MATPRLGYQWRSFATVLVLVAASFTVFLFAAPRAAAVTYVSGVVATDTTWGSSDNVYVITRHVTVLPGVTLTILPGTTVRFNNGQALFVEGRLDANGFPGGEILFITNNSMAVFPPLGIQFNASSTGSVTSSIIVGMERGVTAIDSSPDVTSNFIDHATTGVALGGSFARVEWNYINDTQWGVYALNGGTPYIANNYITNISGALPFGIYVTGGAGADLRGNTVRGVLGRSPGSSGIPGAPGGPGTPAVGILVDSGAGANIRQNTIDSLLGGRGGDGMDNPGGVGGRGGEGGVAAGIIVGNTNYADVTNNVIASVMSGRGGNGGGSPVTTTGGNGGNSGTAVAIEFAGIPTGAFALSNWIDGIGGGGGGNGGDGVAFDGAGGFGGEAYGILSLLSMDADVEGNTIQNLQGGFGGNSTALGGGNNGGGPGGAATGIGVIGVAGNATLHSNSISAVAGGSGGRGGVGGYGGNATGAFTFGDLNFNATVVSGSWVTGISGGSGGLGGRTGGNGGTAAGLVSVYVTPLLGFNGVFLVQGGDGGDAIDGSNGGRGGDALGHAYFVVQNAWSTGDWVNTVTRGAAGIGPPIQASYATGFYVEGSATWGSVLTMENDTIWNVGDRDIWVNNFADATTINVPFQASQLMVAPSGNLYVMNYLATEVYWADGFTPVPGANVVVTEDGATVWNVVSTTGFDSWLLTLDRSYLGSTTATDVENVVSVSYLSYTFTNNPRIVDMASGNTQPFAMSDVDAPTSAANALPLYTATLTFDVDYTASDGSGVGLDTIDLWYSRDAGPWTWYGTQFAGNFGWFSFTAPGDGTYEFETVATDLARNTEARTGTNESWTIVDTTRPGSAVDALATYQNTLSFPVSWAPDPGVTDIATYMVQYNRGFGWTNWLVGTTTTSGMFTAVSQGVHQFRSIATDGAGNPENTPAANDTWTIIDTFGPNSFASPLPLYETTLTFPVSWAPESTDVATYRIDVRDNGGAWTTWIASTTLLTADYTGLDAHTYEFRSVATDFAGNVESQPAGNESWTIVDVTLPMSFVAPLPAYETNGQFTVNWAPEAGVTDIASYRIDVNDDGSGWVTWIAVTTSASSQFNGQDGHVYDFRSIARDRATNAEAVPPTADATTTVDTTAPMTTGTPSGTMGNNNWYTTAVTVTLAPTDATSGVSSVSYRVDSGAWLTYGAPIIVTLERGHKVEFQATDNAGNVENVKSISFDIDLLPPISSATLLGSQGDNGWTTSPVVVTLSATDSASGVASGEYRLDGGAWTPYAGPFSVSTDGSHAVDFRSTDNAGYAEATQNVNFRIDQVAPLVVNTSPRGANTNTTPRIVIEFSETMNRTGVELAFSITPDNSGAFVWSTDSRTLTFVPDNALLAGTGYFVSVAQSAKDMAGNTLPQTSTFQFTTAGTAPPSNLEVGSLWWLLIVAAAVLASLFLLRGRLPMGAKAASAMPPPPPKEEQATIDDVFLLYHDGILIKHETRRLKPDIDTDILSGMLTAVQSFVKDSFRSEEGHLDEMTFGEMHILIGRGQWLILAAMIQGEGTDSMARQMQKGIEDMEATHGPLIEGWDGNMTLAKTLTPFIKKLIRGDYL